MEKSKEITFRYVFSSPIAADHQPGQKALEAKYIVLDLLINKIMLRTDSFGRVDSSFDED